MAVTTHCAPPATLSVPGLHGHHSLLGRAQPLRSVPSDTVTALLVAEPTMAPRSSRTLLSPRNVPSFGRQEATCVHALLTPHQHCPLLRQGSSFTHAVRGTPAGITEFRGPKAVP